MRGILLCVLLLSLACSKTTKNKEFVVKEVSLGEKEEQPYPSLLSEWNLFKSPMNDLVPVEGIIPYGLNTPLFSDYAYKARFIKLPAGEAAIYHHSEVMDFPRGTILIKNFYYYLDESNQSNKKKIIETRLLINESDEWKALTYVWNEDQTEAKLEIAGRTMPVSWTDKKGILRNINYSVPNQVQCKSCHELNGKQMPIGPTARQLNGVYPYPEGEENQLVKWTNLDLIKNVPPYDQWPRVPVWDDPNSGTLDERARAWLEINCAHCHRKEGPAKNSGLSLQYHEKDRYKLGIGKPPVAAGKGSGGLKYAIVPGNPEASILYYRIKSLDPGVMMPEVGRKSNHEEGIALIKEWIAKMHSQTAQGDFYSNETPK